MSNLYTKKFTGRSGRRLAYRLAYGCDLMEALQAIVEDSQVRFGSINFLGSVLRAKLGYYQMHEKRWLTLELDKAMEILSGLGNVSLKDDKPFVHAHLTLLDSEGKVHGGHLLPGCTVFAGEVFVDEIDIETPPRRVYDPVTGLTLWE
ncbi:MAG: DUF296 domain-containing protein [Clostridia bacterium]|nr:DUF296 domain-containing protein [Clostridia bacterium]